MAVRTKRVAPLFFIYSQKLLKKVLTGRERHDIIAKLSERRRRKTAINFAVIGFKKRIKRGERKKFLETS